MQEIGDSDAFQEWTTPAAHSFYARMSSGVLHFARRKPLGFTCAIIVLFFVIIGDAVPESINAASEATGIAHQPVPYLADQLVERVSFLHPYQEQSLRDRLQGSSSSHLFGTDDLGRDVLSRLLYGARVAVLVALGAAILAVAVGASIGIMSGFYMGWVDKTFYRLVDVLQALPLLVVAIVILGIFGSGLWQLIVVLGILLSPAQSRIVRGQTLYVMSTPFVEAARVVGAGDRRIMIRHVLPNVFHLIVLNATVLLGLTVLFEATLSFLGYGLQPPFPSWGQMLSLEGRQYMRTQPGLAIYPGLAIGLLVFAFNLFGDALRDVLDPRLRGSR